MKTVKKSKKSKKNRPQEITPTTPRVEKLVDSLELISSRMLEMIVTNSQLASAQTPEMRALFQKWVDLMADELLTAAGETGTVDLAALSARIGISRQTAASLLLYLDRKGDIDILEMRVAKGEGKNRDICGCMC